MFIPIPTTSRMSTATLETLFITGAQCAATSGECDLNNSPITIGISIVTISDLAISPH